MVFFLRGGPIEGGGGIFEGLSHFEGGPKRGNSGSPKKLSIEGSARKKIEVEGGITYLILIQITNR